MRRKKKCIMLHCFILLISLLCSCALPSGQVCRKNGKPYGETIGIFQGQWDDFYERALSYMEGECHEAALSDLDQALKQKFRDKRMERTYGMHFTDYFPHREKGLIHYLRGEYEIARAELEISLQHEPSEKALYYLDKIRKRTMELEKQIVSVPGLIIKLPPGISEGPDEIRTRDDPVIISGIAQSRQYVSEILVAGKPLFTEASGQRVEFQEELKLDQGTHEFDIIVRNLIKGELKRRIIIHVDRSGPVIALEKSDTGSEIQGWLYDESGVISLVADGETISVREDREVFFSIPANTGYMMLVATDRLGNETHARADTDTLFSPLLAAGNLSGEMTDTGNALAMLLCSRTSRKPVIRLKVLSGHKTCFLEKISVEGHVKSEHAITSLKINSTPILWKPGRMIFFSHSVSLKKGENRIEITAEDESGSTSVEEVFITRQIPRAFQLKYRYSIFVHPFSNIQQNTGLEMFQDFLLQNFTEQNRFRIMTEHGLKKSLSRLSGALYETRNGIEIIARLIDNNTSEVLAVRDVYTEHDEAAESDDRLILKHLADRLAEKFHRELPLADGILTEINGKNLIADFGNKKLKIGWPLVLYRLENPDEKILGSDTEIIGSASIDEFTEHNYGATLENINDNKSEISTGDRVISQ